MTKDLIERLELLKATADSQREQLLKDHTKDELARIVVARRISHAERDLLSTQTGETGLVGWRSDMENAPRDGTSILAWCVHPYASSMTQPDDYVGPVVARWIDHNNGGWTWHGHLGNFTHWMPLPPAPTPSPDPEQAPTRPSVEGDQNVER